MRALFTKIFARIPTWILIAGAIVLAFAFPMLHLYGLMGAVWVRLGAKIAIFVILALGLNIIIGETGLLNLGYIAFFAVGAYTTAILSSPWFDIHFPWWFLFLISGILATFFGLLLGLPTLRLRGDYLAIVTLAFGEIMRITLNNWETLTNGPGGIPGIDEPVFFGLRIDTNTEFYYLALLVILGCIIVIRNLKNSKLGRALNALREDELAAECSGIYVARIKLLSFMVSALFAGLAGAIFASLQKFVNPFYFSFMQSVLVVSMVVLGGMGSIAGAVVGAVALDSLPEIIRHVLADWLPLIFGEGFYRTWPRQLQSLFLDFDTYRMLIFGAVIVAMMIFRPEGLIPNRRRQRELREADPRLLEEASVGLFDIEEGREELKD